jgi:hypothetical protein
MVSQSSSTVRWAAVDFSNLCPILQQLMSNWSIARMWIALISVQPVPLILSTDTIKDN